MPGLGDWGPLLGQVGGQLGSSALGSLLTRTGPNPAQSRVQSNLFGAQGTGLATGQSLLGTGLGAIQQPINYYSSILSGNKAAVTSALAPEISRISEGYRTAAQTSGALQPRGGPTANVLANMPFEQQRDISTLLQTARPQAAQALGQLGQGILGQGANALYASTAAGRDILALQAQLRQMEAERGGKLGAGLFDIFRQFGLPALQKQFPKIFGGDQDISSDASIGPAQGQGPGRPVPLGGPMGG